MVKIEIEKHIAPYFKISYTAKLAINAYNFNVIQVHRHNV